MQTLRGNIKLAKILTAQSVNATATSVGLDTRGNGSESFDSALIRVNIGAITGSPTSVKVKVVESDSSDMSNPSLVNGGDEVTVSQNSMYSFQVNRSKRYLAITYTITGGTTPTVILVLS